MHVYDAKLLHEDKNHVMMSLAKTKWGLNLNSGDAIEGLGAMLISRQKVDNDGRINEVCLQQFAIVSSLGGLDYDIRWRKNFFIYD